MDGCILCIIAIFLVIYLLLHKDKALMLFVWKIGINNNLVIVLIAKKYDFHFEMYLKDCR